MNMPQTARERTRIRRAAAAFAAVLACLVTVLSLAMPLGAQDARRPNVVVILVDDMGYGDIGSYGVEDIRTPHLDRLAREGVRFTDFYANGAVCTPTRAALMTGRYQQRVGLEWAILLAEKEPGLPATEPTLPRLLRDNGYRTGMVGKWHLGFRPEHGPNAHGFQEFFGILSGNVDMYSHRYRTGERDLWENGRPVEKSGYLTDLLTDRAVSFIEQNAADPFFLYVAYNAVHWPFQVPGRPDDVRTEATWYDGTRAEYARMLESMDAGVGRILDALDRLRLAGDTLVIFTNDLLFDLSADPGERHDVGYDEPARLADLRARLARWEQDVDASAVEFPMNLGSGGVIRPKPGAGR